MTYSSATHSPGAMDDPTMQQCPAISAATAQAPPRAPAPWWAGYAGCVLGLGFYQGANQLINLRRVQSPVEAWKPFVWELSSVIVIALLIPLIVRLERRVRVDARPRPRVIGVHAAAAVAFSLVHTAGMIALRKLAYALAGEHYVYDGGVVTVAVYELQKDLVTYAIVLIVIFALRQHRVRREGEARAAALAVELGEARLAHLTAQIEPHFLFNTLNAVSNRMHEDVEAADRMLSRLATLLRAAYDDDRRPLVALSRELAWLDDYAAMMTERFRGQLQIALTVEPGLEAVEVPRLLLQPIVENALLHGLAGGRGRLAIDVCRTAARLRITVSDDGVGPGALAPQRGTGLSNVARRLELLFPGAHVLHIAPGADRGTQVTIEFPAPL